MRKLAFIVGIVAVLWVVVATQSAAAGTTYCGKVKSSSSTKVKLYAHNVSCRTARRVAAYAYGRASKPDHWICSASLKRCYKSSIGSTHSVSFKSP